MESEYNLNICKMMIMSDSDTESSDESNDESSSSSSSSSDEERGSLKHRQFIFFCNQDRSALNDLNDELHKKYFKIMVKVKDNELPQLPKNLILPISLYNSEDHKFDQRDMKIGDENIVFFNGLESTGNSFFNDV